MLARLGNETLIERGYRLACETFGREHVVVATPPLHSLNAPLDVELRRIGAVVYEWNDDDESDVLGRIHSAAHARRWNPASVIFRWTPDDWDKRPDACRRVAAGERLPVELGGEAFTLAMLDAAHAQYQLHDGVYYSIHSNPDKAKEADEWAATCREHISYALFDTPAPLCPPGLFTIDTPADLAAARRIVEGEAYLGGEQA